MQTASFYPRTQSWALIVGTRPEAIKMAPVFFALKQRSDIAPRLIASGQHGILLDTALAAFGLVADINLHAMRENQTLASLSAALLEGLTDLFTREPPDAVLVQGDTTTAFCAALAAFYRQIPVYHIEAGLRSHRLDAPFPEEANRSMIACLAQLHFAPTAQARTHLLQEGIDASRIHVTGNTVIDALQWMRAKPASMAGLGKWTATQRFILVTAHRRESFGGGITQICEALQTIATRFPATRILFPVHPNPNIERPVRAMLGVYENIHLLPPLGYTQFVGLMDRCHFLITDSGGIQEEAAALGKPTLVTRDITERTEAVAAHSAVLAGTDASTIAALAKRLLEDDAFYRSMANATHPYGDGHAAERIVDAVTRDLAQPALRIPA